MTASTTMHTPHRSPPVDRPHAPRRLGVRFAARIVASASLTLCSSAAVAQVPPAVAPKTPAEQKQAAFIAQTANAALNHDLGLLQRLDVAMPRGTVFKDAPAGEVLAAVRAATKSSIEVDPNAVGESGGWELHRVSCEPATARDALDAVLRAMAPDFERYDIDVAAGILVITDERGLARLRCQAQYPLDAMVSKLGGRQDDGKDGASIELSRRELEDFVMLTDPSRWEQAGGDMASISWTGSVATIDAPPGTHLRIRRRLAQLEEALPTDTLTWVISIAEIDASVDAAMLDAAVAGAEGVEALVRAGSARVTAAPQLKTLAGEPAELRIGGTDEELSVRTEPVAGKASRSFAVRVSQTRGRGDAPDAATGAGRPQSCVMRAVPGVRAAVLLEADGRRLLVSAQAITKSLQAALKK